MPIFTPKERRVHYNAIGYGNAPVKEDSQYPEEIQRAYARGQADARNEAAKAAVLGKNSSLSDAEKAQIKQEDREIRQAYKEGDKKRAEQIKKQRAQRVNAKRGKKK